MHMCVYACVCMCVWCVFVCACVHACVCVHTCMCVCECTGYKIYSMYKFLKEMTGDLLNAVL